MFNQVDQFAKIELSRLNYIQNNEKKMRAELYNGLKDAVEKDDRENIDKIGKKVILPSSFISGNRYMHQQYQDAISLLRRFGKPNLFITMTTNPDWREIKENLRSGEKAIDRPDIVARVFKLKKQQLIKDIQKKKRFLENALQGFTLLNFKIEGTWCLDFSNEFFVFPHYYLFSFLFSPIINSFLKGIYTFILFFGQLTRII